MAFYCCGARMQDAQHPQPICADDYAHVFMDDRGKRIFEMFKEEANCNASMLVRHRIIDDILRKFLDAEPDLCVITIGAGLDSRPYRLNGGVWYELDEPAVVNYKNKRLLKSKSPNPLQRIGIDFCVDNLEEKLAAIKHDGPVVIVMEGVFIYLDEQEIKTTIDSFHRLFPGHRLVCDLVNREMVEKYGRTLHEKIEGIGTVFKPVDYPVGVFIRSNYQVKGRYSIVERSTDFGINKVPKFLLNWLFISNVQGNAVYVFESHDLYDDLAI
jgi:methyltransferase (TIGR00027 family)